MENKAKIGNVNPFGVGSEWDGTSHALMLSFVPFLLELSLLENLLLLQLKSNHIPYLMLKVSGFFILFSIHDLIMMW